MATRGRYRDATPAIPSVFLYDAAGDSSFDDEFHIWDTIEFITSHFSYTVDDDKIFLQRGGGFYEIIFQCSYYSEREETSSIKDTIYLNGEAMDGADSWCTHGKLWSAEAQGYNNLWSNNNIHIIKYLKSGDYTQVYGNCSYEGKTKADSCRLVIKFMPMEGWDNSSAGRTEYKGGVMR